MARTPFSPVPALPPGGTLGVVAPSGPLPWKAFEEGLARLRQRYEVHVYDGVQARHRYLAGLDEERRRQLRHAVDDTRTHALIAGRGGYGALRLVEGFSPLPPKLLAGFSDITALHALWQSHRLRSLHGPNVTQLATQPEASVQRLYEVLEGRVPAPLEGGVPVVSGVAEGPLLGGNLAVLASLGRQLPPLEGAVLLLEDVGEKPYRLDRMWTTLKLSGALDAVAGVAFGDFTRCEEEGATYSSREVLEDLARQLGKPCALGFPVGHGDVNLAVPLGARVRLDADRGRLDFLEGLAA